MSDNINRKFKGDHKDDRNPPKWRSSWDLVLLASQWKLITGDKLLMLLWRLKPLSVPPTLHALDAAGPSPTHQDWADTSSPVQTTTTWDSKNLIKPMLTYSHSVSLAWKSPSCWPWLLRREHLLMPTSHELSNIWWNNVGELVYGELIWNAGTPAKNCWIRVLVNQARKVALYGVPAACAQ